MKNRRATGAPRTLAAQLVQTLAERIRAGDLRVDERLPTEAALMDAHGVSRTVVREALSQLQAQGLVATRHGVGTFVLDGAAAAPFRIRAQQLATLQDVVALLELRIGVETEAAALAAQRRTDANLAALREALLRFQAALARGDDGVAADVRFHAEVARSTQNAHYLRLLESLGTQLIPRARLQSAAATGTDAMATYLQRVHAEHEAIVDAIARHDVDGARAAMRTHLGNSRERRRREAEAQAASPAAATAGRPRRKTDTRTAVVR